MRSALARLAPVLCGLALLACVAPQKDAPSAAATPEETSELTQGEAPVDAPAEPALREAGASCTRGDECASGICEGQGCGVDEGQCAPEMRGCTKDLRAYCGCDGETFQASGTCPGRTYQARGACDAAR